MARYDSLCKGKVGRPVRKLKSEMNIKCSPELEDPLAIFYFSNSEPLCFQTKRVDLFSNIFNFPMVPSTILHVSCKLMVACIFNACTNRYRMFLEYVSCISTLEKKSKNLFLKKLSKVLKHLPILKYSPFCCVQIALTLVLLATLID